MSASEPNEPVASETEVPSIPGVDAAVARKIPGITEADARAAMAYPGAASEIQRLLDAEKSSVQTGDPAPDFQLPRLSGPSAGRRVALSDHFGTRPVALVFGSYT